METRIEKLLLISWVNRNSALAVQVVRAMRTKHWIKNAVCLAPLIFSGKFLDVSSILAAFLGMFLFSCLASAIYIINDIYDMELDRQNPTKRDRPIASGALPIGIAAVGAIVLAASSIGVSLLFVGINHALTLGIYAMLNLIYSSGLKHMAILDVISIALGFLLRVEAGAIAIAVLPSDWLFICMFFLALLLGFAKRRGEMITAQNGGGDRRPVLSRYSLPFIDLALGMTASITIISYTLYLVLAHQTQFFIVTLIPVTFAILRYLQLVLVNSMGDKPEDVLTTDSQIFIAVGIWAVMSMVFVYLEVWSKSCPPPC
jgi:4-hydroxybenzoate polyprenyltransferase